MEPISAALTGLALARQGIAFIKENIESANDAKAMAQQLASVFQGHKEFNKQRYDGTLSLKEVAEQRIRGGMVGQGNGTVPAADRGASGDQVGRVAFVPF